VVVLSLERANFSNSVRESRHVLGAHGAQARSPLPGTGGWNMLTADQQTERTGWPLALQLQGRYEDGRRHRVRIGVEIEVEDFVSPQTPQGEVEKLVGMFHPANSTHTAPFSWAA
jgi:hypothetical protein